jgi:hypothetical protein
MRIPSGTTDQVIYFVAVDSTDLTTRETGLTTFTAYRARNGAAAAAFTTPTVAEVDDTNMPGVYTLLLDEDMTIGTGNDSEEMAFHITQASMAPVTRTIELYRPKITAGQTIITANGGANITAWNNTAVNSLVSGRVDASVGAIAANAITATAIASDAITAAKVAADVHAEAADAVWDEAQSGHTSAGTFGSAFVAGVSGTGARVASVDDAAITDVSLDDSASEEIADTVWNELQSAHVGAGTFGEIATEIAAILVDTGTTIPGVLGTPTDTDLATDVANVQTEVDKLDAAQSEPTGVPAANDSPLTKIGRLHMALRNQLTITATKMTFFDDGGAAEWEKDLSDDGTTYTETEGNVI